VADFPEGVNAPAQYGPSTKAAAVYLNVDQMLPFERLTEVLKDLAGVNASPGSVVTS
jgi:transposase